jgi:2-dehydropantoate 2-reductase
MSALTHATLAEICRFPLTRELSAKMMAEAETVARSLGVSMRISIERRIAGAEKVGAHKTSMLQDIEHGRPIELDELVRPVLELAELTGTPTPHINAIYACASLLARTLAAAHGRLAISPA